jgi:hypothetical protein
MKVKDLLEQINNNIAEYGDDFLEWDVYAEQICARQLKKERENGETFKDYEGWEYCRCFGVWTTCPKERIFTINVNY